MSIGAEPEGIGPPGRGAEGLAAPMTDDELPTVLPQHDFDWFFRREYPRVVALLVAISGDRQTAEDVAQEALLRAHERWSRIATYDMPGAWVRRVAINLAGNVRSRHRSEAAAATRLGARPALAPAEPEVEEFWAVIRLLPKRQAAAVTLYYLEDRSVAEVAAILGCAEGTAKAHLHKGRAGLARLLDESGSTR